MKHKIYPMFFSVVLVICLIIGTLGNLIRYSGIAVLVVTLILFLTAHIFAGGINQLSVKRVKWIVGIGLIAMFIGQIVILSVMPNTVYHDPYRVLSQADQMAAGHMTWGITYFWRYANNVPLAYLMSLWLQLTQLFHLSANVAIHTLSILVLDVFIVLSLWTIWQLSHRKSLLIGATAFFVLTPFAYTYYLQVFYSDLPSMLILLLIMRIMMQWPGKSQKHHLVTGIGLVFISTLGMLIKSNIIVLVPALMIIVFILWHKKLLKQSKLLLPTVLIIFGFGLSVPATHGIYQASHFHTETKYEFPVSHWILMGANAQHKGMYNGKDVHRAVQQPDKKVRQQYDLKEIPKRFEKLGVGGTVKLWVVKLGILLNVRDIQDWYNGGYRSAPNWYQQMAQPIKVIVILSYTAATIALWFTLILRLLSWRPDFKNSQQVVAVLAVVASLGYLAFHTLLWETETRYGQVILPLIWFTLAAIPVPETDRKRLFTNLQVLAVPSLITLCFVSLGFAIGLSLEHPKNMVISAQRSQLSAQYQAKPFMLIPGKQMTEDVDLNGHANYFSVQVHAGSRVHVVLENQQTQQRYLMHRAGYVYRLHKNLQPGQYRIVMKNVSQKNQAVDVTKTYHYQLSNHPLVMNGKKDKYASLVYTCLLRYKGGSTINS